MKPHDPNDPQSAASPEQMIETCRKLNCLAAAKYAEKGIPDHDIMSAAALSAFDIAQGLNNGDWVAAINLLRDFLDGLERRLMERDEGPTVQ